ncbi:hypothetical protein [Streptomyces sp. NPDC002054]|uniref:hypothetical protein n=1 Tax=Streptomyces sp. NPDC002054 TaxID=3154663 RepID=UPI00331D6275
MWGLGLLAVAAVVWLWVVHQLVAPFTVERSSGRELECASRVFYDAGEAGQKRFYSDVEGTLCAAERDTADLLALVVLSLPFAAVGTTLYASGATSARLSEHTAELARLEALPATTD